MLQIFLRLGTLLAERLLYIPSVGMWSYYLIPRFSSSFSVISLSTAFCVLFAYLLGAFLKTISRFISHEPLSDRKQRMMLTFLVVPILSVYARVIISRNPDWANDTTLHLSSLSVCPRSAKLNLQVDILLMYFA